MDVRGLKIGLLGGSFNPAHEGHLHITLLALKHLRVDEVWWMVSPQNPLKSTADMAAFEDRLESAREMARHPNIRVTDIEARLGTTYTAKTLDALTFAFPRTRFVWLMGADNLAQISSWYRWRHIFDRVPVAVFDRAPYSFKALAGKAAHSFARDRRDAREGPALANEETPAWIFFHTRLHPGSATQIRASRKGILETKRRK